MSALFPEEPGGQNAVSEGLDAQERMAQLEADLRRSGEYGQMLLRRIEDLEAENQRLLEKQAAVDVEAKRVRLDEDSLEVDQLRKRAGQLEEENRRLQEQVDAAGVASFTQREARSRSETEAEEAASPNAGQLPAARGRVQSDHRLSDVIRQNEDFADQMRRMESEGRVLRERNEELQRMLQQDARAKAEKQVSEEKARMHTEQKRRHAEIMHRAVDKIKADILSKPDAKDQEIQRLQECLDKMGAEGARTREEACLLREQLAVARAEREERGRALSMKEELLTERDLEVGALRANIRQLQLMLEAESCAQHQSDISSSLAAEMEQDEELGRAPSRKRTSTMVHPLLSGQAQQSKAMVAMAPLEGQLHGEMRARRRTRGG